MRYLIFFLVAAVGWGQTQFVSGAVGDYAHYPSSALLFNSFSGISTACTMNGSTLKCGQCGFLQAGSGTKTLQNIHAMIGAVTKAGGTDLRVGIQAPSTTTGPPIQPDGSWASSGNAFATVADASITANTWLRSGTIGGTLSMSNGERWCAVWEPENYAGSDSYVIRGINAKAFQSAVPLSFNGSAWSTPASLGSVLMLLEFTDGTFGSIGPGVPLNVVGQAVTMNTGSTPDEAALKITPSVSLLVDGICSENPYSTSTGDLEWVLYQGTTALVTVANDVNQTFSGASTSTACAIFPTRQTLVSGTTYYAAIKPTTANNVQFRYNAVADAAYWSVYGGGLGVSYSTRTDGGAWSDTDTRRPTIWLLVSGVVNATGGGSFVVAQ